MHIDQKAWHRKHDDPSRPIVPAPPSRCYPNTRQDLIDVLNLALKNYDPNRPAALPEVRASGSHWALSEAAIAKDFFVETQNPEVGPPNYSPPRLNRTLDCVIPGCLTPQAAAYLQTLENDAGPFDQAATMKDIAFNLYHVEAGTRLYELYSRLDADENLPLALETMGGAGGQTIAGAISTGTHGSDVLLGPLTDCVMAIHLIAPVLVDGPGQPPVAQAAEFWLERGDGPVPPLVDPEKLQQVYPAITVLRDNDTFNAVLVSVGRMGLIYSVVVKAGWQYCLEQVRTKDTWSNVKSWINDPTNAHFPQPPTGPNPPPSDPRFVQVVINPNAQPDDADEHSCWITFNHKKPLGLKPAGRCERRGPLVPHSDPPEFANAGCKAPYPPDDSKSPFKIDCSKPNPLLDLVSKKLFAASETLRPETAAATPPSLDGDVESLERLGEQLDRALEPEIRELEGFVAGVEKAISGEVLTALNALMQNCNLGDVVGAICNTCADVDAFEVVRKLADLIMSSQQKPQDITAISYAILDGHDYTDISCDVNADSLEVFFDADGNKGKNPLLINYVEKIFQRMKELEDGADWAGKKPKAFAGYVAVRFMPRSQGLIAMQQFDHTCSLEIAGFNAVHGTTPFLKQIEKDAVDMGGTVHWGQRNDLTAAMVEKSYGGGTDSPLARWRQTLGRFSAGGRLPSFSTDFTRARGLEVV